jgi:predicted amino acid racemase
MTAPRLEIDLDKVRHNARTLVGLLASRGISVTGVTKATCGSPEVATELLRAGVVGLGDSRIENIEAMVSAGIAARMTLIRSPMTSQAGRVVERADVSFNTELEVMAALSSAAAKQGRTHGIVLMVELGDLREGILPGDLHDVVAQTLRLPNLALKGLGTNLACQSGAVPSDTNMAELSALANSIEAKFDLTLDLVSGGNSGNLEWALGANDVGRINDLRLGESILLGREPLHRQVIDGLHPDAFTLVAEVIESKVKPSEPWGDIAQTAFGNKPASTDRGDVAQTILAIGHQDTDPLGLDPPTGLEVVGASSDHLIVHGDRCFPVGTEIRFGTNYSALVRAMTSPYVAKAFQSRTDPPD